MSPTVLTGFIIGIVSLLIGGGTGGFIVAWRRDSRQAPLDEATARKARLEVTELIEQLSEKAVARALAQLERQEQESARKLNALQADAEQKMAMQDIKHGEEINKLHKRITQLEGAMRQGGLAVPPWE